MKTESYILQAHAEDINNILNDPAVRIVGLQVAFNKKSQVVLVTIQFKERAEEQPRPFLRIIEHFWIGTYDQDSEEEDGFDWREDEEWMDHYPKQTADVELYPDFVAGNEDLNAIMDNPDITINNRYQWSQLGGTLIVLDYKIKQERKGL